MRGVCCLSLRVCVPFFYLSLCSFYEWTGKALHFHSRPNASMTRSRGDLDDLTYNMSLLSHFCAKVQHKMHVDAYCTGNTVIQTQTVIHWPTELQKTKELQTNLITDAISTHCLSLFLLHRHKSTHLETLRHRHHCHDLMYWNVHFTSTDNAGQYQSLKTDKPSNKDSIVDVWSHTETENTKADSYKTLTHLGKHR